MSEYNTCILTLLSVACNDTPTVAITVSDLYDIGKIMLEFYNAIDNEWRSVEKPSYYKRFKIKVNIFQLFYQFEEAFNKFDKTHEIFGYVAEKLGDKKLEMILGFKIENEMLKIGEVRKLSTKDKTLPTFSVEKFEYLLKFVTPEFVKMGYYNHMNFIMSNQFSLLEY